MKNQTADGSVLNAEKADLTVSKEYYISLTVLDRWIKRLNAIGSTKE